MPELPIALRRYLEISRQPADSAFHTSQVSISFGEILDAAALKAAWEHVARAHAALRTTFSEGGIATAADAVFDWKALDWESAPPDDLGAAWQALVEADAAAAIATAASAPVRITLLRLPNGAGHALWSFHGALIDDSSISLALHRWLHAYDELRAGGPASDFAEAPSDGPAEDAEWKSVFEGFAPPRPLIVLPLPEPQTAPGGRRSISHTFERPERAELAAAAAASDADLRSLFGAAWAFVIARATTSDDALILEAAPAAAPNPGRSESLFIRRRAVAPCRTSGALIRRFADAIPNPPEDPAALAAALGLSPAEIAPATAYIYRELTLNDRLQLAMPRWMAADTQLFQKTFAPVALRVVATDRPEAALDYDPAILSDDAARLLFDAFLATLRAFAADASLKLDEFALPGKPAIVAGPEAPAIFRSLVPQSLHELFADLAAETPDAIAVEMGEEKLTFSQLNAAANQLSRHLRKNGVETGSRVGLAMPRSPRWVTAILGALKAGAAIVPLAADATEPASGIKAWIVDTLPEGDTRNLPVVQVRGEAAAINNERARGVQNEAAPTSEALAWTDGSETFSFTHGAVAAAFQSTAAVLGLTPADRVLQFAPTRSFTALEEVLTTLLSGATLVLREDSRWATRTAFQEFVQDSSISTLGVPTSFWSQWTHYLTDLSLQAPTTLRLVAISGAQPSPNAAAAWQSIAGAAILLHRTPAASACGLGLAGSPDTGSPALLGQPASGTTARLVDREGLPVPIGLPGHVEIAPRDRDFVPLDTEAFVSPSGEFFDRGTLQTTVARPSADFLAEAVRFVATTHPEIFDAYADQRLVAARQEWCVWIVARDSQRGEPHDFRAWLAGRLPQAPRRIRTVPRLPLDEAGRIDLAALADMLPDDGSALPSQKGSEDEERVRQAISRALGGRRIQLDESISDGRTKPQMAKLLHEAVMRDEPRVELSDFTTAFSVRSLLRNVRGRKSGADSKWVPLQPLRASGKQPPLVFIHDLDGASKIYAPLVAHLGADQPCYAITARGLADPANCHTTVQEMARSYIEALSVFDATGPYRLVGHGFGGLVAFEMARLLTESNSQVPLLVLLAAVPPGGNSALGLISSGWKRALASLLGKKPADDAAGRRRMQDSPASRANQDAARKYTAARAAVQAHIFAPTEDFPSFKSVQSGWEACCEEIYVYQVPCSDAAMMDEPAVESLADTILKLVRNEDLDDELESE